MRVHIFLPFVATSAVLGLCCEKAHATEVTVVSSRGSVSVTQGNHLVPVSASTHLTLPAQIRTGSDGTLDLKDNDSLVHIGPNSTVALPDTGPSGSLVDRYLQSAGAALYNIQSRHGRPMSVETPYLVSVVKGTVFTVAVEDGTTSVTLMEGSLDVSAPGVSQHVLLKPNQSIRHSLGEGSLLVSPIEAAPIMPGNLKSSTAKAEAPATGEVNAVEVALVTRDLAEVGATVSAQHAVLTATAATSASGSTGSSGSSSSASNGSSGSNGGSSGSNGASSGSNGNSSGSNGSSSGSNGGVPVSPVVGCNGKTNGTGLGQCLGHGKP